MKVQLIAAPQLYLPDDAKKAKPDQLMGSTGAVLIEYAGRKCYDSLGTGRPSDEYHRNLIAVGHGSVLEHCQYTFLISGVSRSLTHELVRHRVGTAISQRSTRYCDESESEVIDHPLAELLDFRTTDETQLMEFEELKKTASATNRQLYKMTNELVFKHLAKKGVDKATAKKQARGAARQYLENGLETELVWSANVRALRHVISMRGSVHADAEIRLFAIALHRIMEYTLPEYFSDGATGDTPDGIGFVNITSI